METFIINEDFFFHHFLFLPFYCISNVVIIMKRKGFFITAVVSLVFNGVCSLCSEEVEVIKYLEVS